MVEVIALRKLTGVIMALITLLTVNGCSSRNTTTSPVVTPAQQTVKIPTANDVQSITIADDFAGSAYWSPDDKFKITTKVIDWLKTSKPVSVQIPHIALPSTQSSGGYSGPSRLILHSINRGTITIYPVFYSTKKGGGDYTIQYVDSIIEYDSGDNVYYFDSPNIYKWLKDDQWKQEFKTQ